MSRLRPMQLGRPIFRVEPIGEDYLKVAEVIDPGVSPVIELSHFLPQEELHEVWLVPNNEPGFSANFLERAKLESLDVLFRAYAGQLHPGQRLREKICTKLFPHLMPEELEWHYSIEYVFEIGTVISIVLGSKAALDRVYHHQLRIEPANRPA